MITDKQVKLAANIYIGMPVDYNLPSGNMTDMRKALEAYEQSKPKLEPVAYRFPYAHSVDVDGEIVYQYSHRKDDFGKWYKAEPLYTTPPTREPLSEDFLMNLAEECTNQFFNGVHQNATIHFARAIEQAHGIGVNND